MIILNNSFSDYTPLLPSGLHWDDSSDSASTRNMEVPASNFKSNSMLMQHISFIQCYNIFKGLCPISRTIYDIL